MAVKIEKLTNQQRDAPLAHLVTVVRGPLSIAFDDYVIDPVSKQRIMDAPVDVEISRVILEWLDQGKLKEFIQPLNEGKE